MIPIEFYIAGVLAALYSVVWLSDKIRGVLWKRSSRAKEAAHVMALADQLYLAKGYEREKCFLLMNSTKSSEDLRPVKASRRQR